MRREICAALGAAVLLCAPGKALAAVTNGQIAAVDGGAIVTFNADGTGYHTLYSTTASFVKEPAWSPDGNRIAFVDSGRIEVLDPATGGATALTGGTADSDPAWTPDGQAVRFRRGATLLSVPSGGGSETTIGQLADATSQSLAFGPSGEIARVTQSADLVVDLNDGNGEQPVQDDITSRPAWAPDGSLLAYAVGGRVIVDDGTLQIAADQGGGDESDPTFAPDGTRVLLTSSNPLAAAQHSLRIADPDTQTFQAVPAPAGTRPLGQPAWQPCVAGTTTSCTSVSPPAVPAGFTCPQSISLTVVAGTSVAVPLTCSARIDVVEPITQPAHGLAFHSLGFHANSDFAGSDSFTLRINRSVVVTVNVTVTPKPVAPTLTVAGKPALDRRGRVVARLSCDRACRLSLRVRIKLTTGRVILGKVVANHTVPGRTLKLTLRRGAIPKRRRIAQVRIVGTVTGTDGLHRTVSLSVKR